MKKLLLLLSLIMMFSVNSLARVESDSLENDMEFIVYVSGLIHMQDKDTIERFLNVNGWQRKNVLPKEGKDYSYVYNGERRITLMRVHANDSTIDRILLYDLDTVDPIQLGKYLVAFGYNFQTMESEQKASLLTGLPYSHDTYYYIDKDGYRAMIYDDKYPETKSQEARETSCIIFAVPKRDAK